MCVSRLHRVVTDATDTTVDVVDLDGHPSQVSLLAFEGPPPSTGEWLVVHSGYALERVDAADALSIAADIDAARTLREAP